MNTNALAARALAIAIPLIIASCNESQEEIVPGDPKPVAEEAKPIQPAADYASPEATVKTLIAACADKDKAALAACFSESSEGEFRPIIEQTATDEMWNEFFDLFKGATVTGSDGDKVNVKLTKRDETIGLKKEGDVWKIMGF